MSVILYCGAFDPPHAGHATVINETLARTCASRLVLLAHDKPNAWKPNCSAHKVRVMMLQKAFGKDSRVEIFEGSKNEAIERYKDVSLLIGADAYTHFKQKSCSLPYNKVLVVSRIGSELPSDSQVHGVAVQTLQINYPAHSSTSVRKLFSEHPEWYDGVSPSELPLHPDVVQHILQEGLYASPAVTNVRGYKKEISQEIERIHPGAKTHISCLNFRNGAGLSKNYVFRVAIDDSPRYFVKAFVNKDEMQKEIRAIESFQSLHIAKTPEVVWVGENHIGQPLIKKQCLLHILKEGSDEDIIKQSRLVGVALGRLHAHTTRPIVPDSLDQRLEQFSDLFEAYRYNPGVLSITHGDASAANVFVDDDQVLFVDLGNFGMGHPGYEKQQMISSFHWLKKRFSLPDKAIQIATTSFREGYEQHMKLPKEVDDIYSYYWSLKG